MLGRGVDIDFYQMKCLSANQNQLFYMKVYYYRKSKDSKKHKRIINEYTLYNKIDLYLFEHVRIGFSIFVL